MSTGSTDGPGCTSSRLTAGQLTLTVAVVGLVALAAAVSAPQATSWHYFHDAASLLFADSAVQPRGAGLDLYLTHPEFQFGPVSVLAAAPFAFLPSWLGTHAVMAFATLLGALAIVAVRVASPRLEGRERRRLRVLALIMGGMTLAIVWTDVAVRTAHLDDALALASTAVACAAVARGRPGPATAALIIAAAAKPWALAFAPLALVPPGRFRAARLGAVFLGVAATWLPFVIDEPATVTAAGSFTIQNAPSSALRVLGFADPATPGWVRPAQLAIGLLLAIVLVRLGRWQAVVMVVLGVRLMLDPGVHHYYTAGLVLGVLLWESVERAGRLPWLTVTAAIVLETTPTFIQPPALAGSLRLALTAAVIVAGFVLVTPRRLKGVPISSQRTSERPMAAITHGRWR